MYFGIFGNSTMVNTMVFRHCRDSNIRFGWSILEYFRFTSNNSLSRSLSRNNPGKVRFRVAMATRSCLTDARLGRALPFACRLSSWYLVVMATAHSIPSSLRWATSPQTHLTTLASHTLVLLWLTYNWIYNLFIYL